MSKIKEIYVWAQIVLEYQIQDLPNLYSCKNNKHKLLLTNNELTKWIWSYLSFKALWDFEILPILFKWLYLNDIALLFNQQGEAGSATRHTMTFLLNNWYYIRLLKVILIEINFKFSHIIFPFINLRNIFKSI